MKLCPKIPLRLSPHEAYYRKEMMVGQKWLKYADLSDYSTDDSKLKSREHLALESFNCQWFLYLQLTERFKANKKKYNFEHDKIYLKWNCIQMNTTIKCIIFVKVGKRRQTS